jgi:hypothetical protein
MSKLENARKLVIIGGLLVCGNQTQQTLIRILNKTEMQIKKKEINAGTVSDLLSKMEYEDKIISRRSEKSGKRGAHAKIVSLNKNIETIYEITKILNSINDPLMIIHFRESILKTSNYLKNIITLDLVDQIGVSLNYSLSSDEKLNIMNIMRTSLFALSCALKCFFEEDEYLPSKELFIFYLQIGLGREILIRSFESPIPVKFKISTSFKNALNLKDEGENKILSDPILQIEKDFIETEIEFQ